MSSSLRGACRPGVRRRPAHCPSYCFWTPWGTEWAPWGARMRAQGQGLPEPAGREAWTHRRSSPWANPLGALGSRRPRPGGLGLPGCRPWCWQRLPAALGTGRALGLQGRGEGNELSPSHPAGPTPVPCSISPETHKQPQRRLQSSPRRPAASLPPASPTRPSLRRCQSPSQQPWQEHRGLSSLCHQHTHIHPVTQQQPPPRPQQRPD